MKQILKELTIKEWVKVIKSAPNDKEMIRLVPEDMLLRYIDDCTLHLSGPELIELTDSECAVLCVVKNGEQYIHDFISYYFDIGIKHIYFLDNGSDDDTVEIAKSYNNVSVFQTKLTYRKFWNLFKRFVLEKFGTNNGWSLVVDIDEYFDYPESANNSLPQLLNYLNSEDYNVVVTQMLDMFPKGGILASFDENSLFLENHIYYDNDQLDKHQYYDIVPSNAVSNQSIMFHTGGVRNRIFGLDTIFLTKHALIKYSSPIKFEHDHYTINGRVADISTVLYHYKFHGDFATYVDEAIESGVHWNNSFQYRKYKDVLVKEGDIVFYEETSRELKTTDQLVEEGFLVVSDKYLEYFQELNEKKSLALSVTNSNDNETTGGVGVKQFMKMFEIQDRRYQYFTKKVISNLYNQRLEDLQIESDLNKKLKYNRDQLKIAFKEANHFKKENEEIKNSASFKLGYKLTRFLLSMFGWVPSIKKKYSQK